MAADPKLASQGTLSDPIVTEARDRYNRCAEWEAASRARFINDLKFRHGDSDNGYQWPNAIRRARDVDSKPCLTINQIRQHNLMITNEAKQNKAAAIVRGMGGGATKESADVMMALIRHIESQSNAQDAYETAVEFQVDGGIGWWRIVTDYAPGDSFDQEIYIREIKDPLSVYMDPDCQKKDCSDGKFAFVFDTMPRDEFEESFPKYKELASVAPLGMSSTGLNDWMGSEEVMVCEYFRMVPKKDRLISFMHPQTRSRATIRESRMDPRMAKQLLDHPLTKHREVWDQVCEWKLIAGEQVIDETIWPGSFIPLIRVIGEETIIDGQLDRKGHTRALKDAQRMYNYNASSQVEHVALQGKTPWTGAAAAIEEFESLWNTANTVDHSYLPFKHVDDDGNPLPEAALPRRIDPPKSSEGFQTGMDTSFNQMMMASGQWQNQMGMNGNERTGTAIQERQQQGDTATYHFRNNFLSALRTTAMHIIDLAPKVYDTKRVIMCLAEDGTDLEIEINPAARQAYLVEQGHNAEVAKRIFNPALGRYEIKPDSGPAYGTRQEQTVSALTLLLTQAPGLTGIIGDLLLRAMNFKEADEAALRLKRMVPPQALGQGPSQQEQLLQQQVQALQQALTKSLQAHGKDQLKLAGKSQMRDIDVYKAETDRFKALSDALGLDESAVKGVLDQLVNDAMETKLQPILDANKDDINASGSGTDDEAPPMEGAQKAPDGNWYLADPTRRSKWLKLAPLAREMSPTRA